MLLEEVQSARDEKDQDHQTMKDLYERLCEIRGDKSLLMQKQTNKKGNKNASQLLEDKIEELARVLKEMQQDNIDLNQKLQS